MVTSETMGKDSTVKKRITIQDIADKAEVSISTVSRVLNGNVVVAESKRVAVMDAVNALGYRPNVHARGLASGQSMAIGVLTQAISSPFYDAILRSILEGLRGSGYSPIIADGHWQAGKEQRAVDSLMVRRVDGLIVLGTSSESAFYEEIAQKTPLIVIGRNISSIPEQCIIMDNFQGGLEATQHLINLGHRKIAHITGILSHQDAIDRRAGYLQALESAGLDANPDLIIEGQFSEQSGVLAVEMLLMQGHTFSAIFCANDQMAYGARLALFRRGIRVPEDVSIVGYDDQPASAYIIPPLTTIRHSVNEIGLSAASAILSLIKGNAERVAPYSAELIIRESTTMLRYA